MTEVRRLCPGSCESSLPQHPKYGSQMQNGTSGRRRYVELDTCWGVPVATACITFLSCIASSSYGYLYVLFMEKHHVGREQAAWPQSALVISGGCAGLLVSVVQKKFSIYQITLLGGIMASAGVVASSFAPNIAWLSLTFGVIQGAGIGTTLLGVAMYLLLYFDKYKATVTAIKDVGTVAAGVAGVPWTSLFVKEYGLQGSLLLTGGFMIHIVPLVMLIKTPRPLQICQGKKDITITMSAQEANADTAPTEKIATELVRQKEQFVPSPNKKHLTSSSSPPRVFTVFKWFPFFVLVLLQVIADYTFSTFMTTIVDYAGDKGAELERAKTIIMFTALGQALGRVVVPLASDKISFSRSPIAVACLLVTAVCLAVITSVSAFEEIAALACLAGVAQGYIQCIRPVLVADHVGMDRFSLCCGIGGLVGAPVCLSGPAILGFFRDNRGSYDRLYFMIAGLNLGVGMVLSVLVFQALLQRPCCPPKNLSPVSSLETTQTEETSASE
ncbi:monocarboxylate transporter 9-like isoform X5 [Dermacentor silvarum]|uniref:monocarboxylate transporter 9-like isoform X2 n=1 Tax=Dermacentor silvarum TaxID=543639 RepID=UPI0021014196|nr:monocarboxylate transporter 9-like isoform X2 [Dermacentor silvarum]XP_049519521.1 monocarboxylate transporter 9-like isoform X3 [Dermacentor silvarum]XP_049519522.1 monocarboxylate transporter 9-like isoform X4 [Dermacentor silvarum]XP_049519523.1 monocarboxylate transporter 9-like isoform X5 [Dermacentor silvarum]